jgi:hypothetical protein
MVSEFFVVLVGVFRSGRFFFVDPDVGDLAREKKLNKVP